MGSGTSKANKGGNRTDIVERTTPFVSGSRETDIPVKSAEGPVDVSERDQQGMKVWSKCSFYGSRRTSSLHTKLGNINWNFSSLSRGTVARKSSLTLISVIGVF